MSAKKSCNNTTMDTKKIVKEKYSEIEWYKVVGLRHRIVHEYFGIDLEIIWQILHKDLPELKQKIMQIMSNEETG